MKFTRFALATAFVAALVSAPGAKAAPVDIGVVDDSGKALMGDADHGAIVFHKCGVCHSIKPGVNMIGPLLTRYAQERVGAERFGDWVERTVWKETATANGN